jgi:hypothetical protein
MGIKWFIFCKRGVIAWYFTTNNTLSTDSVLLIIHKLENSFSNKYLALGTNENIVAGLLVNILFIYLSVSQVSLINPRLLEHEWKIFPGINDYGFKIQIS